MDLKLQKMNETGAKKPTVDIEYASKFVSKVMVSCMLNSLQSYKFLKWN